MGDHTEDEWHIGLTRWHVTSRKESKWDANSSLDPESIRSRRGGRDTTRRACAVSLDPATSTVHSGVTTSPDVMRGVTWQEIMATFQASDHRSELSRCSTGNRLATIISTNYRCEIIFCLEQNNEWLTKNYEVWTHVRKTKKLNAARAKPHCSGFAGEVRIPTTKYAVPTTGNLPDLKN